ncbi:Myosin-VIIa [Blattella germanica]|nr:Myosin-VIIa [Blattella germanica]
MKGGYVWLKPNSNDEFDVPLGVKILTTEGKSIKYQDDDGQIKTVSSDLVLKPMHTTSANGVEDMITLADLQEFTILRNLHYRYNKDLIYTYTGSILVAVNPYQILPIYTSNEVNLYKDRKLGELPPHIFAIGDSSFSNMKRFKQNHGESGAGKTESTKLILRYLAAISGKHSWIEQQILEANPILEAFGNAKTVRNDNSSRFGKYIDINFNTEGVIEGAKIEQYLLEKSRIVSQNSGERNYHIFYSMLAGLSRDEKSSLGLTSAEHYNYLIGGKSLTCDGRDDAADFADVRSAMKVLNFSDEEILNIVTLLAAILHLGNVKYNALVIANIDAAEIPDHSQAQKIAAILGVSKELLIDALTRKTIFAHGEKVVSNLSVEQAIEVRDAFVKGIYGQLFIMIVNKINNAIFKPKAKTKNSIGVLDIFGFENFDTNSFEQLCINYANENLQQFFVRHIFKLEQEEYTQEGINWKHMTFGTDGTMLTKVHKTHEGHANYLKPRSDKTSTFGLNHFAGIVFYEVKGFLEKNRDTFSTDLKQLIHIANNKFLKELFIEELSPNQHDTKKQAMTLSRQFRKSLEVLMKTLGSCQPFFIRCIKPNSVKKPKTDCRAATAKICQLVLGKEDYQLGHTKVFLKDAHDTFLEQERERILTKSILILQRSVRTWVYRKRFLRLRSATLTIQRIWRGRGPRLRYQKLRHGYLRLQAVIRSRMLKRNFCHIRNRISKFQLLMERRILLNNLLANEVKQRLHIADTPLFAQISNNGMNSNFNFRKKRLQEILQLKKSEEIQFKKAGHQNYKQMAEENYQTSLDMDDEAPDVDKMFEFIDQEITANGQMTPGTIFGVTDTRRVDGEIIGIPQNAEPKDDLSEFNFRKYAAIPFAAKALWITILRFMGDLAEPRYEVEEPDKVPVMTKINQTLTRSFTKSKEFKNVEKQMLIEEMTLKNMSAAERRKMISMTLKRKNKLNENVRDLLQDDTAVNSYTLWLESRHEIYCQICKQLTNNPSKASHARGWILLSLCVGCFPPSEEFVKYLKSFIRGGPPGYAPYCEGRLDRTFKNGPRSQPPSWIELQATKSKKPIVIDVTFMDGTVKKLNADSATTAEELVNQLCENINLKDKFGFALFIALFDKVSSLGNKGDHVMDAISQCEQYAKEQGAQEKNAPWRLYFRKEIFIPWHDPTEDAVATNLIYQQVVRGFKYGEYRCDRVSSKYNILNNIVDMSVHFHLCRLVKLFGILLDESDIAMMGAQQYYVENGVQMDPQLLTSLLPNYIPEQFVKNSGDKGLAKWEKLVSDAFQKKNLILAVSWTGIYFVDDEEQVLLELSYPEITAVALFKRDGAFDKHSKQQLNLTQPRRKLYTLASYADEHFRPNQNTAAPQGHMLTSAKRSVPDELWKHTREPIKLPLLKKLLEHEEFGVEACTAFNAILKYMGDLPTRRPRAGTEYTDKIFTGPLRNDMLRDEIYCQIMKQLTDNKNRLSEERGWELMWLATGLFSCSQNLMKELKQFLRSRHHPVSQDSLHRIQRILRNGQRKYPPHQVEVEAIQHKSTQIFHRVYFPDDTDEAFEVDSSTRARDLCQSISERLDLRTSEGFSLFVKLWDKVFSVPDNDFFFDYVRLLTDWMKKARPSRTGHINYQYQIFFMKKLWLNTIPGKDKNADLIFHFPQEMPKYLRALLYRTKFGDSKAELSSIPHMLSELVPSNLLKIQSGNDWKKSMSSAFSQNSGMKPEAAKEAFLQYIHTWPTFGSAFFDVKQTTENSYPEVVTIAINKRGISIIHPQTKDILVVHPFTRISNWSSGNTFFHVSIGNLMRGSKLLCETALGYKMDDLLTSYTTVLHSNHIGKTQF